MELWRRVLTHRAFLKAHTCPRREAQWRSRAKRNKCRRPSAASYAGFVLERNEAFCFGVAVDWARVVFHEGLSSHWECRGSSDEHSLLSARLLARKAPGDLFGAREENAVSSSKRTSQTPKGIFRRATFVTDSGRWSSGGYYSVSHQVQFWLVS